MEYSAASAWERAAATVVSREKRIFDIHSRFVRQAETARVQFFSPFTEHGSRHEVRVGVYSINLTNHGNSHDVYNNEASPFFRSFTGFQRSVDGFILSFGNSIYGTQRLEGT